MRHVRRVDLTMVIGGIALEAVGTTSCTEVARLIKLSMLHVLTRLAALSDLPSGDALQLRLTRSKISVTSLKELLNTGWIRLLRRRIRLLCWSRLLRRRIRCLRGGVAIKRRSKSVSETNIRECDLGFILVTAKLVSINIRAFANTISLASVRRGSVHQPGVLEVIR